MRRWAVIVFLSLVGVAAAADTGASAAPTVCSNTRETPACQGAKEDLKAARRAFAAGLKLEQSHELVQALDKFEEAARWVPQNIDYLTAREVTRQNLAGQHLDRGNRDMEEGRRMEALAEFRTALNFDPDNEFAQQRVADAAGPVPVPRSGRPEIVEKTDAIAAKPIDGHRDFHYRGDSRGLLNAVAASFGLTVMFDDNFPSRRVRFDLEGADFETAIHAAGAVTKTFTVAVENKVLLACAESPENHRLYDRMGLRSFYIPGGAAASELNELLNSLRTLFEFKFASLNAASSTITLRGPQAALEAATQFLGQLDGARPEVMIDLKVFQVSHTYARNIGLHVPDNFNLFNIPVAALGALGGQNIQDLINQLISSGGINQAGNQSISALLQQLQSQQNSIFSQPLATFGGGLTLMGLSLDQLSVAFSMNESSVRSLDHVQMRAGQEKEATFKLGSRYPILNAAFSPISNSSAISKVIGNQSFTAPFPSVSYEDIGLTLKAKPLVHNNSDVALELEVQFRTLGTVSSNGIPVISNREFKGGILLKEGEPAVVAGMITETDQKSLSGLPVFSKIPGLGILTAPHLANEERDELLILITPYVVRGPERGEAADIWLK